MGNIGEAEQIWQLALHNNKISPEIYSRLANIHRSQDNIPALIFDLKSLYSIQPNNAQVAFELGLLLSTQEPKSALAYLEEAAQMDPSYKESAFDLQQKINTAQLAEEPAYTLLEAGRSLASMEEWVLAIQALTSNQDKSRLCRSLGV
jgi:tetratricopeptide (TPR) repeat protein